MKLVALLVHPWRRGRRALTAPALFAGVLALIGIARPAQGQVVTSFWLADLALTNSWSNPLNWVSSVVPQPGYNVTLTNGVLFTTVVNQDVDATVAVLTIGSGATLAVGDGRLLTLTNNSTINGTLSLNASSGFSELLASGSVTLSGTGVVTMGANVGNRIRGASGADILTNQITLQGGGSIGVGSLSLVNEGTIDANTSVPLILAPNSSGVKNTGTLRATNNATLLLQAGTFTNTGGTIEAQAGSTVAVTSATIDGGNVTLAGSGALQLSGATLTNVTLTNSATGVVRAVSGINTFLGTYLDAVGAQVRIDNGATLSLQGVPSTATVNGGIYLDATGSDTALEIAVAGLTLNGPGQLVLSNSAQNRVIGAGANAALTLGGTFTVQGAGQLGDGLLGFTNQGTVIANQPTPLVIKPSVLGFSNSGTLRATNGATLGLAEGTFSNTGSGAIVADANSHVDLSGSTIAGGTLTSVGAGHFHAYNSSILKGVTLTSGSNVELPNGETLTLAGSIVNHGTLSLLSTGSSTDLKIDAAVDVSGTGTIALSDSSGNRIYAANTGASLTIGSGQTLSGAGEIGRDTLSLTNQGTVVADGVNPLVVDNSGAAFTNAGTLKAAGSGGVTLADANVTNQGTIEVTGGSALTAAGVLAQSSSTSLLKLSGGTLAAQSFSLGGGTISGTGTLRGAVSAGGTTAIVPGGADGIGALAFTHTFTLGLDTGLYFDLGGTTPGSGYDQVAGSTIALNGSLFLTMANGFEFSIAPTDTFTLITASTALNGTFAGLADGARLATTDGLGSFQVNYLANSVTLSHFQAIPEPSTWALLGVGAFAVALAGRRRRSRR